MTRMKPINHGTDGGYQAHLKRGEKACPQCHSAHAAYIRDLRARIARNTSEIEHGTTYGYSFCRLRDNGACADCRQAHKVAQLIARYERMGPTGEVDTPWMVDAACRGLDPAIHHPQPGGSYARAEAVCRRCPVRTECLEYAIGHREDMGMWGGTTASQRISMRGQRKRLITSSGKQLTTTTETT